MTKPLWEAMEAAGALLMLKHGMSVDAGKVYSAEIRAIAAWIEQRQVEDYAVTLPDVREVIEWLTTEADRAERGEVEHD